MSDLIYGVNISFWVFFGQKTDPFRKVMVKTAKKLEE
jgi:hypothetical protein